MSLDGTPLHWEFRETLGIDTYEELAEEYNDIKDRLEIIEELMREHNITVERVSKN